MVVNEIWAWPTKDQKCLVLSSDSGETIKLVFQQRGRNVCVPGPPVQNMQITKQLKASELFVPKKAVLTQIIENLRYADYGGGRIILPEPLLFSLLVLDKGINDTNFG